MNTTTKPATWFEEGLAEFFNLRDGVSRFHVGSFLGADALLTSKYAFGGNLMNYLYLQNKENKDIFKEMLKSGAGSEEDIIKEAGNKAGIKGDFKDIIKYWLQDAYSLPESEALGLYSKLKKVMKKWE